MALLEEGFFNLDELKRTVKYPSQERMARGPVAIIECNQEIPCNPCELACRHGAISLGEPITNLPVLFDQKCTGCGACIAGCPGLAIFVIDKTYADDYGTVAFPYEYDPLPEKGQEVEAVDRSGKAVCRGSILKVHNPKINDGTPIATIVVPLPMVEEVRGIRRIKSEL